MEFVVFLVVFEEERLCLVLDRHNCLVEDLVAFSLASERQFSDLGRDFSWKTFFRYLLMMWSQDLSISHLSYEKISCDVEMICNSSQILYLRQNIYHHGDENDENVCEMIVCVDNRRNRSHLSFSLKKICDGSACVMMIRVCEMKNASLRMMQLNLLHMFFDL